MPGVTRCKRRTLGFVLMSLAMLCVMAAGVLALTQANPRLSQAAARSSAPATETRNVKLPSPSSTPVNQGTVSPSPIVAPKQTMPTEQFVTSLCTRPVYALQVNTSQVKINTCAEAGPTFVGYDSFTKEDVSQFTTPSGPNARLTTIWWSGSGSSNPGPRPGGKGMSVFLGHTGINEYAVFNDIGNLTVGDQALVRTSSGQVLNYSVCAVKAGISKYDPNALRDALANHPACADNGMAFVTCSGTVVPGLVSHNDNTAVFFKLDGVV